MSLKTPGNPAVGDLDKNNKIFLEEIIRYMENL